MTSPGSGVSSQVESLLRFQNIRTHRSILKRSNTLTTNIPNQSDTFDTINYPTLTNHYHPKFFDYLRVHSWCCILHGFRHINNHMYLPIQYHTEYFYCHKNPLYLACSTCFPTLQSPGNYWSFYFLSGFTSSKMSHIWNHIACSL